MTLTDGVNAYALAAATNIQNQADGWSERQFENEGTEREEQDAVQENEVMNDAAEFEQARETQPLQSNANMTQAERMEILNNAISSASVQSPNDEATG